jgi:protein-L-isoaspartate(D-aspartate) O-methyltransferase
MWDRWSGWALRSRQEPVKRVARMIREHWHGVINAATMSVTNTMTGSLNNKLQWIKRRACPRRRCASRARQPSCSGSRLGLVVPICACLVLAACPRSGEAPQAFAGEMASSEFDAVADPPDARALRQDLVRELAADVRDERVLEAMRHVPRHLFVPGAPLSLAYANRPVSIGHGQTISQPLIVAIMSEALRLRGGERVLEIGTGSGYQAAVLALLAKEVYTIEIVPELGEAARKRLAELGYPNVHVRIGDGYLGWPESAPFDAILVTAAPDEVPPALLAQLAEGGTLVAPVGKSAWTQRLHRYRKQGSRTRLEDLGGVRFVPMVRGE